MRTIAKEVKLLKKCLRGNRQAFEAIVAKYQELVCSITFSGTADIQQSEELAHQTFINAWKNLYQLKDLARFRPWLCTIARNIIRDFYRKNERDIIAKAKSMENINDSASNEPGPLESAIKKEHEELVSDAIKRIPERYREPLVLYYRQQKSIKQVARSLDLSQGVVKQRLQRGRKMIKEQISSIVEETLSTTGPKKAFTTAVIASIAGVAIKGSGVAAASIAAGTSTTGATASVATLMSGVTAKIITAAAVVAIGVGSIVAYKHVTKPSPKPEISQTGIVVEKQGNEREKSIEETMEQSSEKTANLLPIDKSQNGLETEEPFVTSPEPVSIKDDEFKFVPRGVLSGVITDARTGKPVTDVKVYISFLGTHEAGTDSNGFYFFEDIKQEGDYYVYITSNKYVGVWDRDKRIRLEMGSKIVKHFALQRACQIKVKVIDEDGNPIKGVNLIATSPADEQMKEVNYGLRSKSTDVNGEFLFGGFVPSDKSYLITATHRARGQRVEKYDRSYIETYWDYAPGKLIVTLTDPNVIEEGEILLKKGIDVIGYAEYEDGTPASDLKIGARPHWWHCTKVPESYSVNVNGYFTLKHIVQGRYGLDVHLPERPDGSGTYSTLIQKELPLENDELLVLTIPGESPQNLVSISGTIKWIGEGKPGYVYIDACTPQGMRSHTDLSRNRKGELENNFLIERLEPGIYTLRFTGGGIEDTTIGNVRAPSDGLVVEIPIKHETTLSGKVVDKYDGKPVTKFEVGLNNNWIQFEHPEGEFELASKGNECKRVSVRADGFATKLSEEICPDANEPTIIKLGIGGAIEGKVVDEKGVPIENAKISYRYKRSRGEKPDEKYITDTDANGWFIIEDVPEGDTWQWFVISHPNYAPKLKQIEIDEDYITDVKIVLIKGGAVEGYVCDSQGKPMPDTTLYFLDETSYSHWEQNRGRLGSVITDSNGFYRIMGMPEKLCFGFRQDPDKQLGIVRTSILPKNGRTLQLDFGGQWYATGRLLQDGKPMANIKVMIRGNTAGHETAFTAYALTDAEGRFTFWGIPSGRRYVYWLIPGLRSWEQWSEIGRFDFESGIDIDMGDFNLDLSEVVIKVAAENPDESLNQLDIQRYDDKMFYGRRVGQLSPRTDPNGPYIFLNVAPGIYETVGRRSGYPTIHKVFEIRQGQKQFDVDLWIPDGSATLSGKVIPSDPRELQMPLMLRNISQELTMGIQPAADGSYEIGNLPAGDYIIGRASVALSRQSKIKEVSLKSGENKKLDIEVDTIGRQYGGYLVVVVVTEEGLPLAGTKVLLEEVGNVIEPHFDSDKSKSFAGDAGEYILIAEHPGYRKVQQRINIKPKEGLSTQEILKPVVITMSKQ